MVTDNGVGIDAARLEALNREADVSSTQGGEHGLGLKLVRQIVKAHSGTVQFRQAVSHGLEIFISFSANRVARESTDRLLMNDNKGATEFD